MISEIKQKIQDNVKGYHIAIGAVVLALLLIFLCSPSTSMNGGTSTPLAPGEQTADQGIGLQGGGSSLNGVGTLEIQNNAADISLPGNP